MNEVMNNKANQTPIEIALGIDERGIYYSQSIV